MERIIRREGLGDVRACAASGGILTLGYVCLGMETIDREMGK